MSHSKQLPVASSLVATPAWAAYTAPEPRTWRAVRFLRAAVAAVCAQNLKLGWNLRSDAPRAPSADDRRRRAAAQWHNCQWSITSYDDDGIMIRAYHDDRIRL